MNKLVLNEFKKIGFNKLIIIDFSILIVISFIAYFTKNKFFETIYVLIPFLGILICLVFSNSVCGEIISSTFKVYLTKKINRYKIIISKLIFVFIYIIHLYLLVVLYYILISKLISNFTLTFSIFLDVFKHFIPLFFIGILSVFLSTIINSSILNVCIGICVCLLSSALTQILFSLNIYLIQYTFLPYLDFNILRDNVFLNDIYNNYHIVLSINKGITILIFHIILFICLILNFFTKKDIKN